MGTDAHSPAKRSGGHRGGYAAWLARVMAIRVGRMPQTPRGPICCGLHWLGVRPHVHEPQTGSYGGRETRGRVKRCEWEANRVRLVIEPHVGTRSKRRR